MSKAADLASVSACYKYVPFLTPINKAKVHENACITS